MKAKIEAAGYERKGRLLKAAENQQRTLPGQSPGEPSQPGARWVRGPCSSVSLAAPLATLLHLRFRCSHLVVQIGVLGHFTYDSLGILSYTNTIPMLTNCL